MIGFALQAFLLAHVPLAGAMGVRVVEAGEAGVRLALPLAPNLNHHGTAFGGSVSAAFEPASRTTSAPGMSATGNGNPRSMPNARVCAAAALDMQNRPL